MTMIRTTRNTDAEPKTIIFAPLYDETAETSRASYDPPPTTGRPTSYAPQTQTHTSAQTYDCLHEYSMDVSIVRHGEGRWSAPLRKLDTVVVVLVVQYYSIVAWYAPHPDNIAAHSKTHEAPTILNGDKSNKTHR